MLRPSSSNDFGKISAAIIPIAFSLRSYPLEGAAHVAIRRHWSKGRSLSFLVESDHGWVPINGLPGLEKHMDSTLALGDGARSKMTVPAGPKGSVQGSTFLVRGM